MYNFTVTYCTINLIPLYIDSDVTIKSHEQGEMHSNAYSYK